jgi:hypothetical protein
LPEDRNPSRAAILLATALAALPLHLSASPLQATKEPQAAQQAPKPHSPVYINKQYGFRFDLPASWKGYSILSSEWSGTAPGSSSADLAERGPEITIRHPLWTEANPRQDIPIMVFTILQWNQVKQESLIVSAAPIGPMELGRNSRYVFALPPRYNYAFPEGFEEVERLLESKPLHPF